MFTDRLLYRPGKSDVADPLSRSPGVVAAMLPTVAGPEMLCRCAALHCAGPRQQVTFLWVQPTGGSKVREPLPPKVMASVAAVTQSQVSQPAVVSIVNLVCHHLSYTPVHRKLFNVSDLSHFQK